MDQQGQQEQQGQQRPVQEIPKTSVEYGYWAVETGKNSIGAVGMLRIISQGRTLNELDEDVVRNAAQEVIERSGISFIDNGFFMNPGHRNHLDALAMLIKGISMPEDFRNQLARYYFSRASHTTELSFIPYSE